MAKAKKRLGKHAIKQVDRLLSNKKLSVVQSFSKTVPYVIGARKKIVIAMDQTNFDSDNQATLQQCLRIGT